jgi:hypothetical protein
MDVSFHAPLDASDGDLGGSSEKGDKVVTGAIPVARKRPDSGYDGQRLKGESSQGVCQLARSEGAHSGGDYRP